ncbi:MAG: histone deacetylase family protein [Bacillota bacterium]
MKVYFHKDFLQHYSFDPAAEPGRLDPALEKLKKKHSLTEPQSAGKEDILRVHTMRHWRNIAHDELLYHTAMLAAGASLDAAETALNREFAFALCRPPGHHASADSCWGFCYFNNIAVAVSRLLEEGIINSALIVDFDLHYGDGTANIFQGNPDVSFWHSRVSSSDRFVSNLANGLEGREPDLIAVSAGFDRGVNDWGNMLGKEDYKEIGSILGSFSRKTCENRLFAVLEGGYNPEALAIHIDAFLDGLEKQH